MSRECPKCKGTAPYKAGASLHRDNTDYALYVCAACGGHIEGEPKVWRPCPNDVGGCKSQIMLLVWSREGETHLMEIWECPLCRSKARERTPLAVAAPEGTTALAKPLRELLGGEVCGRTGCFTPLTPGADYTDYDSQTKICQRCFQASLVREAAAAAAGMRRDLAE